MQLETLIFGFCFQYLDSIAFLILSAIGLSIIFGMMGVINMAHGELMMIGAYTTAFCIYSGIPVPIALLLAGITSGISGIILERLIIRHFYKQLLSSLVVTWGISMVMSQVFLLVFGPTMESLSTPFSDYKILVGGDINFAVVGQAEFNSILNDAGRLPDGVESFGVYRMIMFLVSVILILTILALLKFTQFGGRARATMDNPNMASALGINISRVYAYTFGFGSALAGIAGGMFALTASITPFFGAAYTAKAFVTVVVGGGASLVSGLVASVVALGGVQTIFTNVFSVYIGFVAIIASAFIILLFMPTGISGYVEKQKSK